MTQSLADLERLFRALADATRLRILGLLLTGDVCDIHESLRAPQPRVSRHLASLRRAGLVRTRREGLWVHYRLADLTDPVMHALTGAVRHALTHTDAVRRDAVRLQKRTGCCLPATPDARASCCAPLAPTRHA
jgi:ArsR family transcriptional regulator